MKKHFGIIFIFWLTLIISCDPAADKTKCYPTRITTTIASGGGSSSIISDYHYEGDTLSYIIFSTGQTHYFQYNDDGKLSTVREVNDKLLRKDEYVLTYDGKDLTRVDISVMNLDYEYRTDLDTFYYAYREYEYTGKHITKEYDYSRSDSDAAFTLQKETDYSWDESGNLSAIVISDISPEVVTTINMSYDVGNHPFSALNLLFDGKESHVNNLVSMTNDQTGSEFAFTLVYNDHLYPEQLIEKENGTINRIVRYDYDCR
ncbi:MAG: hypothetical protein ACOYXB_05840 [Bacteroidota bacterium]